MPHQAHQQDPAASVLAQPAVVVLIAVIVIGLVAAGLLTGELYARRGSDPREVRASGLAVGPRQCVPRNLSMPSARPGGHVPEPNSPKESLVHSFFATTAVIGGFGVSGRACGLTVISA